MINTKRLEIINKAVNEYGGRFFWKPKEPNYFVFRNYKHIFLVGCTDETCQGQLVYFDTAIETRKFINDLSENELEIFLGIA